MSKDVVRSNESDEFGKDHGLVHEAIVTGRKVGAGKDFWSKLAHDEDLFGKVVSFVGRGGIEATIDQKNARAIMGANFLGVEEIVKHFKVRLSEKDLRAFSEIPFSEDTLRACADTHILIADCGLSINQIKETTDRNLFYSKEDAWYRKEPFAKKSGDMRWHLIRKDIVPGSLNKNWQDQQTLLAKEEATPEARVMVYTIILYCLATGVRLFPNIYVRTSTLDSGGGRVNVGYFGSYGLYVYCYSDGVCNDDLGLAAARPPATPAR